MDDFPSAVRVTMPAGYVLSTSGTDTWPREAVAGTRGLLRFICTSNPFYVISAGLIFFGLRLSFDASADCFATLDLAVALVGYTLLLAAAACILVRFGQVWQDVRTILLLIVVMLLAVSVTFDEAMAANSRLGARCLLGGLLLSIALSEGLLRVIRLSLPALFRLPYFLILALFFLYPLAVSLLVPDRSDPKLHWGPLGFSALGGGLLLALLPAVRRGPQYVRDNGSPWQWPLFPGILFGVLAVGVCGRTMLLCTSLDPTRGAGHLFGFYFLVPVLFAANVVLLEVGIVGKHRRMVQLALAVPAGLLALAITASPDMAVDLGFLKQFSQMLRASPLFVTLLGAMAFYAVAMLRRVPHAAVGLTAAMAALTVCGPSTFNHATLVDPRATPILLIGVGVLFFLLAVLVGLTRKQGGC